jgi:hypothetical protein
MPSCRCVFPARSAASRRAAGRLDLAPGYARVAGENAARPRPSAPAIARAGRIIVRRVTRSQGADDAQAS